MNLSEFLGEFQLEAGEKLDLIASQLLRLERDTANPQPVREMFLAAHTIKGGAAMLRLTDVEALAHAVEDLLSSLRDEQRVLDDHTADLLFQSIDTLRAQVASATSASVGAEPDASMARFINRLRANARGDQPQAVAPEPARGPRALALLVDDSPTVRELYRMILEDAGFEVELCDDGQVALSRALAQLFELVVSGLQNKSLGGFELTSALQATPRYANVPIVLTSVDADPELTRRAAACGARALVRKGSLQDEQLSQALRDISAQRAA